MPTTTDSGNTLIVTTAVDGPGRETAGTIWYGYEILDRHQHVVASSVLLWATREQAEAAGQISLSWWF